MTTPPARTVTRPSINGSLHISPSAATGNGRQLPTTPRRYGQWAATLLFLIVCVLAAAWMWQHKGDQVEVLVVRTAVPAGAQVERSDLASSAVSGVAGAIPVAEVDRVVGSTAASTLVPGQVLVEGLFTDEPIPTASQRVVGLQVDATRAPDGLTPGDVVTVLVTPPPGDPSTPARLSSPEVLAASATVHLVAATQDGGTRLSLLVWQQEANRVAAFGAAGQVAVVQAPPATAEQPPAKSEADTAAGTAVEGG